MRNKFTELINQGVASFNYTPIAHEMPEQDPICRMYNNIWSIPSDTHMSCVKNENGEEYRVITGSMVSKGDEWEQFVCACNWGAVNFRTAGYWCLGEFLQKNGLRGNLSALNGDTVYLITPIPVGDMGTCVGCPNCCVTTESKIPGQISTLTMDNNPLRIKECYKGKSNLYEVCEALNESIYVKGNNWTVNGDKVMCPIGNKIYVL